MQDIVKNERPYNKIRQDIIDLIYTLESFTAQELLLKADPIEGDEKVKEDIVQDLLCHYRNFDLIMDEGRFYPQKKGKMWSEKEVQKKIRQAKLDVVKEFAEKLIEKHSWDVPYETEDAHYVQVVDVGSIEDFVEEFTVENEKGATPKSTQELYAMFRKEIDKYSIPLIVEDLLELVEFISIDGETVGMCGGTSGYIDCLYVLPKHRRQGYAKKLALDWYGRYKRPYTPTRLHIVNNNVPALNFWNSVFELKEVDCSAVDTLYEIVKVRE